MQSSCEICAFIVVLYICKICNIKSHRPTMNQPKQTKTRLAGRRWKIIIKANCILTQVMCKIIYEFLQHFFISVILLCMNINWKFMLLIFCYRKTKFAKNNSNEPQVKKREEKKTLQQPNYWQTFANERNITRQILLCTSNRYAINLLICDLYFNLISKFYDVNTDNLVLFSMSANCMCVEKFVILDFLWPTFTAEKLNKRQRNSESIWQLNVLQICNINNLVQ